MAKVAAVKGATLTFILLATAVVAAALVYIVLRNSRRSEGFEDTNAFTNDATQDSRCVYDEVRGSSPNRVVLYYADWCGHCKAFKPEFDRAAETARKEGLDVEFVRVNADKQGGTPCLTYKGVSGFPTVLIERAGTSPPYEVYGGERTAPALLEWARSL